jgi:hypothetical protein
VAGQPGSATRLRQVLSDVRARHRPPAAGHAYDDRPDMESSRYHPAGVLTPVAVVGGQVKIEDHGRAVLPVARQLRDDLVTVPGVNDPREQFLGLAPGRPGGARPSQAEPFRATRRCGCVHRPSRPALDCVAHLAEKPAPPLGPEPSIGALSRTCRRCTTLTPCNGTLPCLIRRVEWRRVTRPELVELRSLRVLEQAGADVVSCLKLSLGP